MAKQVLSQRDLKTQQSISVPAAGLLLLALKLTVFIVVLNQELKRLLNTDDVVGGALQQQRRCTIALGSTTLKIYNKFMTLLEVQGI
jgi:hypothetical protein